MSLWLAPPLVYPDLCKLDISAYEQDAAARRRFNPGAARHVNDWLNTEPLLSRNLGGLEPKILLHCLSAAFMARTTIRARPNQTLHFEIPAFRALDLQDAEGIAFDHTNTLSKCLFKIRDCLQLEREFRNINVTTVADSLGYRLLYPQPESISQRIQELAQFISLHIDYPAFCGVVAMVVIGYLHPFRDGNGRVSRIVYNWISDRGSTREFYLPIYECAILSDGGYLIRAREACYFGRWQPILDYVKYLACNFQR